MNVNACVRWVREHVYLSSTYKYVSMCKTRVHVDVDKHV